MAATVPQRISVEDVELKVQSFVFSRRIRFLEFLRSFDPLRHGIITRHQFARALDQCGIALAPSEMRSLCDAYSDEASGAVRYRDFAESIETVFRISNAEKNPEFCHPLPGASLPSRFTPRPLTEEQQAVLEDVLQRLALLSKTRGIIFKYCYQSFDRLHSGFVSPAVFRRNFPFDLAKGKFTEEEIRLLAERFTSENGKGINYALIHDLVTEKGADIEIPFATSPYVPRPCSRRWSHEELPVEQKIQALVALKQLPLRDFFKDFDRLRKGHCTRSQARAVFASFLGIPLNDDEWTYLVGKYTSDEGMFLYAPLCDIIDRVLTRAEKIDDIEAIVRRKIEQTRKSIKPVFQDFDRQRTMHITRLQFARVMSMLSLPLTEEELDLLCLRYCDKGNHKEFNYVNFVQSVDTTLQPRDGPADRTAINTEGSVYFTSKGSTVLQRCMECVVSVVQPPPPTAVPGALIHPPARQRLSRVYTVRRDNPDSVEKGGNFYSVYKKEG